MCDEEIIVKVSDSLSIYVILKTLINWHHNNPPEMLLLLSKRCYHWVC